MSIRPVNYDIFIEIGRSFNQRYIIQDPNGTVVDLSGWAVNAQMRPTYQSTVLLAEFNTTISGIAGQIDLELTYSGTGELELTTEIDLGSSVSSTNAVYDIMLTDLFGQRHNYVKGTVTIEGTSTLIE